MTPGHPSRRRGLAHDVERLHREHPGWTASDIAAALGCGPSYVRATKQRLKLAIPGRARRAHDGPAPAAKPRTQPDAEAAIRADERARIAKALRLKAQHSAAAIVEGMTR